MPMIDLIVRIKSCFIICATTRMRMSKKVREREREQDSQRENEIARERIR